MTGNDRRESGRKPAGGREEKRALAVAKRYRKRTSNRNIGRTFLREIK